jgi:hypothetical protein
MIEVHVEGNITCMQKIVREVFLDNVTFVAAADYKLVDVVMAVGLENMPDDRHSTDFNHGLGLQVSFLADACTQSASQNYSFH